MTWMSREGIERVELAVKAIAVAVGLFGVFQYFLDRQETRGQAALELHADGQSGRVLVARETIGTAMDALVRQVDALPQDQQSDAFREGTLAIMGDTHGIDYDVVVAYFERARLCVIAAGCDGPTVRALLGNDAKHFALMAYHELERRTAQEASVGNRDYALGLRCLSGLTHGYRCFNDR